MLNDFYHDWGVDKIEQGPFKLPDHYWEEAYAFIQNILQTNNKILCLHSFKKSQFIDYDSYNGQEKIDYIILQKDQLNKLPVHYIKAIPYFTILFENPVFYIYAVNQNYLQADTHKSDIKFIHLHIPKTAGHSILSGISPLLSGIKYFANRRDYYAIQSRLSGYSFLSGHIHYSDIKAISKSNTSIFAVLRDPLERFISAYLHANRMSSDYQRLPPLMQSMRNLSLEKFIKSPFFVYEINRQTIYLSQYKYTNDHLNKHRDSVKELMSKSTLKVFQIGQLSQLQSFLSSLLDSTILINKKLNSNPQVKEEQLKKGDLNFIRDHLPEFFIEETKFINSLF